MGGTPLMLQQADESTLSYVETLLEKNGLPSQDVQAKSECFYIGSVADNRVGIGGVEVHGSDGLLRSIAIQQSERGNGYGTALCNALETTAQSIGAETLYLLTTTAAEFFTACGYEELDRSDAPATIQQTTQFNDLCPTTATCLKKSL